MVDVWTWDMDESGSRSVSLSNALLRHSTDEYIIKRSDGIGQFVLLDRVLSVGTNCGVGKWLKR